MCMSIRISGAVEKRARLFPGPAANIPEISRYYYIEEGSVIDSRHVGNVRRNSNGVEKPLLVDSSKTLLGTNAIPASDMILYFHDRLSLRGIL